MMMDELLAGLKAIAEITRIRILFALAHGELNVSELTYILGQSQPRVSRHLKVMTDAALISRHKEGNWVLFRLGEQGLGSALSRAIVDMLPGSEALLAEDLARFEDIRSKRQDRASTYFAANAVNWEKLRNLHVLEADVEAEILDLAGTARIGSLADLGTGTGRMLELFSGRAQNLIGLDLSLDMLAIARASLQQKGIRNAQVRQADIYALPLSDMTADLVIIHQVLHFLDDPQKALIEARRILAPHGRILVVDFAPHQMDELREQHAHRRLGIAAEQMTHWLARAGLHLSHHRVLPPPWLKSGKGLTVSLWLAVPIPASSTPQFETKVSTSS
jgi:ubiquinone/menaquinone biosynthesis C-methylase UbiE